MKTAQKSNVAALTVPCFVPTKAFSAAERQQSVETLHDPCAENDLGHLQALDHTQCGGHIPNLLDCRVHGEERLGLLQRLGRFGDLGAWA